MRSKRRIAASRELYEAAQEYCRQYEVLHHEELGNHFFTLVGTTDALQDATERALSYIGEYEVDQSRRQSRMRLIDYIQPGLQG